MGRRSRERKSEYERQDVLPVVSTSYAVRRSYALETLYLPPTRHLIEVEDNRTYHPLFQYRPARTVGGRRSAATERVARRPSSRSRTPRLFTPSTLVGGEHAAYVAPRRVLTCVRRQRRREVIMARGYGGAKHRKPRRNWRSNVTCGR